MSNRNRLAAVGDRDSVILFKTLGFITVFAETEEEVDKAVKRLAREETSIIYITEEAAEKIPQTLERFKALPFPVIIPIPNKNGSKGFGLQLIRENVEKAIGTDILNT